MTAFSRYLKRWRKSNKISQGKLAKRLGIPPGTYKQYESGRRDPPAFVRNSVKEKLSK